MKCPKYGIGELKVGQKNGKNVALCNHCNSFFTADDLQNLSAQKSMSSSVQEPKRKKGSCFKTILKLMGIFFGIFIVIGFIGNIMDNNKAIVEKKKYDTTVNGVDILFRNSVRNDTTDKWKLARVSTSKDIIEYAKEYYDTYFSSDDEIHAIINFHLETTNKLSMLSSDIMDIQVMEHVDKEELDANTLFSGMPLSEYHLTLSTGEVKEISDSLDSIMNNFDTSQIIEDIQPMETLIWLIELNASSKKYDGYTLDYDEQTITVNVWKESFTNSVNYFQSENLGIDNKDWMWLKNYIKNSSDYMYDCIKTSHGHEGMTLVFNVLDDTNRERILLTIVNDNIVYDILEE